MKKGYILEKQDFDALLTLFSEDREEAGKNYEKLRAGLVRFFRFRGCSDPQSLADETFNRVASKISSFRSTVESQPTAFVYGFARKILLEDRRSPRARESQLDELPDRYRIANDPVDEAVEEDHAHLQKCLGELSNEDREVVTEYFSRERGEKIDLRRRMAEKLGCSSQALQSRIFRIKAVLRGCIDRCRQTGA